MKPITLRDVNNAILGTDIKILSEINILDSNNLNCIPLNLYGVYVINLKYKESYIGMSSRNRGIQGRLLRHICETWHRNIVESINIFVTKDCYASFLEKILIKIFEPELNTNMYGNCSLFEFTSVQKQLEFDKHNTNLEIKENKETNLNLSDNSLESQKIRRPIPVPVYDTEVYMSNSNACIDKYDTYDDEYNIYENEYNDRYDNDYWNIDFITWLKRQKGRYDPISDIATDVVKKVKIETIKRKYCDTLYDAYNEYKYIYLTNYRKQSENFGLILIDSLNPKLREQLNNNNDFDFNYKIVCKKYDEISTIKNKNMSNAWEELYRNNMKNDDILNSDIKYWNEHTKKRQDNFNLRNEKVKIIKENYNKLLSEIDNEITELLKKYGKTKEYVKESYYYSLIKHDIQWLSDKHE